MARSGVGNQSVCMTMVFGQMPFSAPADSSVFQGSVTLAFVAALDVVPPLPWSSLPPHAAAPNAPAARSAASARVVLSRIIMLAPFVPICSRAPLALFRVVPPADDAVAEVAHAPEHDESEEGGEEDRGQELLGLQPLRVEIEEPADARLALTEEEVADDRADHRQPGRDAKAGEDRGHRRRELQAPQTAQPAGAVECEEVVVLLGYGQQPEQRVRDDREQREDHDDDHAALEVEAEPEADERDERKDRDRLQDDGV